MNLNESMDRQPNARLVKQEVLESQRVLFASLVHQVSSRSTSETILTENKYEYSSPNELEAEIISNRPLQLKSETPNRDCDVESNANAFIKQELLHEELDIKSEDETIQETQFDDKYNWGNEMSKPTKIFNEVKPFKCGICDYSSKQKSNLKKHLNIHTREKQFKCHFCDYSCARNNIFKKHLRIHTGEKPFKCYICDYCSRQNCDLQKHLKIHTGERPFKCNICHYCTTNNSDLKRHLRIHTGEKPFKCSICDFRCAQNCGLRKHFKIHTGEKPFECNICHYRCRDNGYLKSHLRVHNKM